MKKKSAPQICPLCSSNKIEKYWYRCWNSPAVKVYACQECSLIFLSPMMGDNDSSRYYINYVSHLTSRGVASDETPGETFIRRDKAGEYRIEIARKFVKSSHKVLEIGGGCGNFIGKMLEKKIISSGTLVESCIDHLRYAGKKFNLNCYASLDEIPKDKFDAIFMFHVLEHIKEPVFFLERCSSLLKKAGIFFIEVPSSSDPLLSLFRCNSFKDFYFQPMHHYTYSEKSLGLLFEKSGYRSQKFIYHQRYSLKNHINWLSTGKPGPGQEFSMIFDDEIENIYKKNLIKNKQTDTIFGVFQK